MEGPLKIPVAQLAAICVSNDLKCDIQSFPMKFDSGKPYRTYRVTVNHMADPNTCYVFNSTSFLDVCLSAYAFIYLTLEYRIDPRHFTANGRFIDDKEGEEDLT